MINEDFILPDKWYIEVTYDNRKIINNWKIKQKYKNDLFENLYYKYVCHRGGGWNCKIPCSYTQITLSQFKSHVLKEIEDNQDNQDYLIKLLKEISNEVK
jgi:hypothetical protein